MENLESVQRDLKNKLLGRIDEVHDDVKQLRQIVDTNLEDIANELMAKNSKVSGIKVDNNYNNQPVPICDWDWYKYVQGLDIYLVSTLRSVLSLYLT